MPRGRPRGGQSCHRGTGRLLGHRHLHCDYSGVLGHQGWELTGFGLKARGCPHKGRLGGQAGRRLPPCLHEGSSEGGCNGGRKRLWVGCLLGRGPGVCRLLALTPLFVLVSRRHARALARREGEGRVRGRQGSLLGSATAEGTGLVVMTHEVMGNLLPKACLPEPAVLGVLHCDDHMRLMLPQPLDDVTKVLVQGVRRTHPGPV